MNPIITATLTLVTPSMAAQWLEHHNFNNRRLRKWWAFAISEAMRRGEWMTTHQGIAFTVSGRLLDGQHRLHGIVQSGIPAQMFVFQNVPDEAFKATDTGIKRSGEDTTGLNKKTAEVCRVLARFCFSTFVISPQQMIDVAETGVAEVHDSLLERCGKAAAIYSSASMRAAAILLVMNGHPQSYVFDVYANLIHQRFDLLPPVAHSLIRQVNDNKVQATNKLDLMARGIKVMTPENKNLTKLYVEDSNRAEAAALARSTLVKILPKAVKDIDVPRPRIQPTTHAYA